MLVKIQDFWDVMPPSAWSNSSVLLDPEDAEHL
jgi:hypothetical protein